MSLFFYGCFTEMMIYLMSQGMEISVLKSLLNSIASVFQLSSRESIKCEPVQKYHQKIEEMLKLLKPILDAILDAEIPKDEILQKEFAGLCQSVDNLREMFENWEPLMSKVYFVRDKLHDDICNSQPFLMQPNSESWNRKKINVEVERMNISLYDVLIFET